ncbi:hypothetical protein MYO4S_00238 [Serratia phage 4S]|nr:hypothetical protein MYO4S_00238 [Serratia phage 4S]
MIYDPDIVIDDYTREVDMSDENNAWKLFRDYVGLDIAMIFKGNVNRDTDYGGISPYFKLPVVRLDYSTDIDLIHKRLLEAGYEYEKFQSVEYSCVRHVDNKQSLANGIGDKIYIFVKVNDVRFIIFFSESYTKGNKTSRTVIEQFASLHKGHRDYKTVLVEQAIHEARQRVLGDKYKPEIMFTTLRGEYVL